MDRGARRATVHGMKSESENDVAQSCPTLCDPVHKQLKTTEGLTHRHTHTYIHRYVYTYKHTLYITIYENIHEMYVS